jgi:hypothetical protein
VRLALGIFCIAIFILIMVGGTVYEQGWFVALVVWGYAMTLLGLLVLGTYLIATS